MRLHRALTALPLAFLLGCGGDSSQGEDCVVALSPTLNAAYAGTYAATFAPRGSAVGGTLRFGLTVAANGTVSGTVVDPTASSPTPSAVTGLVGDQASTCGTTLFVELRYTPIGGIEETLRANGKRADTPVGKYKGVRSSNDGTDEASGSLVVSASE